MELQSHMVMVCLTFLFTVYLFIFRERGREGERRERNIHQLLLGHALTRDQTHNPGVCPDRDLNPPLELCGMAPRPRRLHHVFILMKSGYSGFISL